VDGQERTSGRTEEPLDARAKVLVVGQTAGPGNAQRMCGRADGGATKKPMTSSDPNGRAEIPADGYASGQENKALALEHAEQHP
jgi:hypothetical protein